ncbi:hypothetical protein F4802DRAFT_596027 [Xylaria palmicola]|nr:hypothetical protein F4802DRAFT_596027 [Xylaria palmicola]
MASSSETMGSSQSQEGESPSWPSSGGRCRVREWSQFELNTVCALVCQHAHRPSWQGKRGRGRGDASHDDDWVLGFATKLNKALHGVRGYKHDIPVGDVRALLAFLEAENGAIAAFLDRQPWPFRLTRPKMYAFQRLCVGFNYAFHTWAVAGGREGRRRNPGIGGMSGLRGRDGPSSSSGHGKDNRLERNPQLLADTRKGWMSDGVHARRSREGLGVDNSAASLRTHLPRRPVLPARPRGWARRQALRATFVPPPPPSPSILYEQMGAQPFGSYGMTSWEGPNAATHTGSTHDDYHDYSDPALSAQPYPPASPAYAGFADLRRSIHPMGPTPEASTAPASPAYQYGCGPQQGTSLGGLQLGAHGSLTSPVSPGLNAPAHTGYRYPEPAQTSGSLDYSSSTLETPTSPSSPMHMPDAVSVGMMNSHGWDREAVYDKTGADNFFLANASRG